MKNAFLFFCSLGLAALGFAQPRLSPLTRHYLQEMKQLPAGKLPQGYVYKQEASGRLYVSVLVQ